MAYVLARRELNPWLALVVPLILMTLGPAGEVILAPEFSLFLGLALWLGAILLIQRGQVLTDALGCLLLVLGIASHSIVVVLLPATVLVLVLWTTPWRTAWRRAWVIAVPIVLYLAWHAAYHPETHSHLSTAPGFVVNSFVYSVEDISGIRNFPLEALLAGVVFVLACARCVYMRRVPRTTIYAGVGLLTIWVAGGLNEGMGRIPGASRYQFANALLLMLALAPLVPRIRFTPLRGVVVAAVVGGIVVSNFSDYTHWEEVFRFQEQVDNAQMAALEVARGAIHEPDQVFTQRNDLGLYWPFTPKAYFATVAANGSPVNVGRDIEHAEPDVKHQADRVLVRVSKSLSLRTRGSERSGRTARRASRWNRPARVAPLSLKGSRPPALKWRHRRTGSLSERARDRSTSPSRASPSRPKPSISRSCSPAAKASSFHQLISRWCPGAFDS